MVAPVIEALGLVTAGTLSFVVVIAGWKPVKAPVATWSELPTCHEVISFKYWTPSFPVDYREPREIDVRDEIVDVIDHLLNMDAVIGKLQSNDRTAKSPYNNDRTAKSPYNNDRTAKSPHSNDHTTKSPYSNNHTTKSPYSNDRSAKSPYNNDRSAKSPHSNDHSAKSPCSNDRSAKSPYSNDRSAKSPYSNDHSAKSPCSNDRSAKSSYSNDSSAKSPCSNDRSAKSPYSNDLTMGTELENLKEVPGFKAVLRAVIKAQIQLLLQQLSDHADDESLVLTAGVNDGTISQLGSGTGKGFLEGHEEIKSQFLGHCLKSDKTIAQMLADKTGSASQSNVNIDKGENMVNFDATKVTFDAGLDLNHTQTSCANESEQSDNELKKMDKLGHKLAPDSTLESENLSNPTSIKIEPITENEMELEITGVEPGQPKAPPTQTWPQGPAFTVTTSGGEVDQGEETTDDGSEAYMQETFHAPPFPVGLGFGPSVFPSSTKYDSSIKSAASLNFEQQNVKLNSFTKFGASVTKFDAVPKFDTSVTKFDVPSSKFDLSSTDAFATKFDSPLSMRPESSSTQLDQKAINSMLWPSGSMIHVSGAAPQTRDFGEAEDMVLRMKTPDGGTVFKCGLCNKCFGQKIVLVRHLRRHTGEKPFKCRECDSSFSRKSTLRYHMSSRHPGIALGLDMPLTYT
ncbi:ZN322-like protein [Mya arenaria]|uniref:ZN322-like protein n=1 Tax=Mya arenaria TaxID=6604 RepID=A0ABY7F1S3_MYAAR|nr:ZN322-like protein [Mya arenaria]